MKKLLKSGICGFVNSARITVHRKKVNKCRLNQKKKKKTVEQKCRHHNNLNPNRHIDSKLKVETSLIGKKETSHRQKSNKGVFFFFDTQ